jgi:hypothetical protein
VCALAIEPLAFTNMWFLASTTYSNSEWTGNFDAFNY